MNRMTLWWENPNHAGALFAMVASSAAILAIREPKHSRSVFWYTGMVLIWWMICLTKSRQAMLAVPLATACAAYPFGRKYKLVMKPMLAMACIGISIAWLTHGFDRFSSVVKLADGSAGARLTIWRYALAMLSYKPVSGWGGGAWGRAYIDYFQPIGDNRVYLTTGNSFLNIALEHGGIAFLGVMSILYAILFRLIDIARNADCERLITVGQVAIASFSAFCVCSVFSSIWDKWSIVSYQIVLTILALLITSAVCRHRVYENVLSGAVAAAFTTALLFAAAAAVRLFTPLSCVSHTDSYVILRNSAATDTMAILALPDDLALGFNSIRLLRETVETTTFPLCLHIHIRGARKSDEYKSSALSGVVALGRAYARLKKSDNNVAVVKPIYDGNEMLEKPAVLILQKWDDIGDGEFWRAFGKRQGINTRQTAHPLLTRDDLLAAIIGLRKHEAWNRAFDKI